MYPTRILGAFVAILLVSFGEAYKTGLVLAGGGAKGAFAAGVLEELCKTKYANSWSIVTGTSIGAFNAGVLAQFNQDEQCSKGVPAVSEYWSSIQAPSDIYKSSSSFHVGECLNPLNAIQIMSSWSSTGGMCDVSPGIESYTKAVKQELIQSSDVELWVPASSLSDITAPVWFTNSFYKIIDALIASASISPLVPPHEIDGAFYVDGGIFHNTPIIKAIENGAEEVIVVILHPIETTEVGTVRPEEDGTIKGSAILNYYFTVLDRSLLIANEVVEACVHYPHVKVMGIYPSEELGKLTDFEAEKLQKMMQAGREAVTGKGLVDLCDHSTFIKSIQRARSTSKSFGSDGMVVIPLVAGVVVGVLGTIAGTWFMKQQQQKKRTPETLTEQLLQPGQ